MNVLLLDPAGALTDFGMRCIDEGHDVKMWVRPVHGEHSKIARGLIPRVPQWQPHMKWADIVVLSDNAYEMRELEKFNDDGYPIFGTNMLGAKLELDRDYGMEVMKRGGLNVMPSKEFKTYREAIEYVKANPKRYVSKPSGDADKALSYVSSSAADMVFMLEHWQKNGKNKLDFILQEFVPGIEVAVGGWMGPNGFSRHICENWEHKKLMPSNYGCNTGEQGTVLKYVKESKLFDDTLAKFEDYLCYMGHRGYVDLAFIIDEAGEPRPLEWTTRPGWPLFNIQMSLHKGSVVQWMKDLLDGKDTLKVKDKVCTGIVIPIGDYPKTKTTGRDHSGYPIYGLTGDPDLHLCEVMAGKGHHMVEGEVKEIECLVTAGDYVAVACGTGSTVSDACDEAYALVKTVDIPESINVRDDVGERCEKQIPMLQKHGLMTDWEY